MSSELNVYEKVGGKKFFSAVADIFYDRVVCDARLSDFFRMSSNLENNRKVRRALAEGEVLLMHLSGGFPNYHSSFFVDSEHSFGGQKLTEYHLGLIDEHLEYALIAAGMSECDAKEVLKLLHTAKKDLSKKIKDHKILEFF